MTDNETITLETLIQFKKTELDIYNFLMRRLQDLGAVRLYDQKPQYKDEFEIEYDEYFKFELHNDEIEIYQYDVYTDVPDVESLPLDILFDDDFYDKIKDVLKRRELRLKRVKK